MTCSLLFIGDPHFQINNTPQIRELTTSLTTILTDHPHIKYICVGGDLLHTHERLHTTALNMAINFLKVLREYVDQVYVLVGNHDYIQNQQFLTENHWMNALKECKGITIVDKVIHTTLNSKHLLFTPYVPNGRFEEALDTLESCDWRDADIIFAHQEFKGCSMGHITSVQGDTWELTSPQVISGHIHSYQKPQPNILYPGSCIQHAFGESNKSVVCMIDLDTLTIEDICLDMKKKRIISINAEELDTLDTSTFTPSLTKIKVVGTLQQFKSAKRSRVFKNLEKNGFKLVFKVMKIEVDDIVREDVVDFYALLTELVEGEKDDKLYSLYNKIRNDDTY